MEVLLEISTRFIDLPADQADGEINNALRILGEYVQADRACIDQFSEDGTEFRLTHIWESDCLRSSVPAENTVLTDRMPWYTSQMRAGQPLVFSDLKELPAAAEAMRRNCQKLGIESSAIVPLMVGGDALGSVGVNVLRERREWPRQFIHNFRLFSQIVGNAIIRKRYDQRLADRLRSEKLIGNLSLPFLNVQPEEVDTHIDQALQQIGKFLDVERVSLIEFTKTGAHLNARHYWTAEGYPLDDFVKSVRVDQHFPVVTRFATECESLVVPNTENFPENGVRERDYCRKAGIKSLLMIPLPFRKGQRLVLAIDAMRRRRVWSADLVERFKVMAAVFASAILSAESERELAEAYAQIERLNARLQADNTYLREEVNSKFGREGIVGQTESLRQVLSQAEKVAPTDSTVLILGETGTGKELLARAIHSMSTRKERPLVVVNCVSLPASLIESELFGREKGAYTGALTKQAGRFEIAKGSTIFLDEIGELAPEVQVKLLRVLQTGEFERLGSPQTLRTDVRVIAATNRDLLQAVRDGTFREDLYYRLNVFPLSLPPLRERREDIPRLAWSFVTELAAAIGKTIEVIPEEEMQVLQRYAWPGNIRELRNVIERSVIVTATDVLNVVLPKVDEGQQLALSLEEAERRHILRVLNETDWQVKGTGGAAEILEVHPSTLHSKMQKLGIRRPK